jgi:hypothetical protein
MAGKSGWLEMVPDAIVDLLSRSEELVDRKEVERLFDVKPRQAQRILEAAGATVEGKLAVISAGEFALYLDHVDGSGVVAAERERRQRFAERLGRMRQERMKQGPLFVEVDDLEVRRVGYGALPPGVFLGKGPIHPIQLVVDAKDVEDLLQKLALLACAMQGDGGDTHEFPELERMVGLAR